jgi:uncharacterized protein
MIRKIYDLKALDVDTKNRKVKVGISRMGNEDLDKDIIELAAFNKTILEKGPKGSNSIWHLTDHGWRIADSALSKYEELAVQGDLLAGVAPYRDTWLWREVAWPLYEAGDITQHSIGFQIIKSRKNEQTGIRVIEEVDLYEGSAVLWGANPETPTMEVIKSQVLAKKESFEDRVEWICKAVKSGKYKEDETLLILELKQLEDLHKISRKGTQPEGDSTEPQKMMMDMSFILSKHFL